VQVDVAFGDAVVPPPELIDYPTVLPFPTARLRAYPREAVIAEKFQAIVRLGFPNSRLKDYFDVCRLAWRFPCDGPRLYQPLQPTFARLRTPLPVNPPPALGENFVADPHEDTPRWTFLRRSGLSPLELSAVVETLRVFLLPIARALVLLPPGTRGSFGSRLIATSKGGRQGDTRVVRHNDHNLLAAPYKFS